MHIYTRHTYGSAADGEWQSEGNKLSVSCINSEEQTTTHLQLLAVGYIINLILNTSPFKIFNVHETS